MKQTPTAWLGESRGSRFWKLCPLVNSAPRLSAAANTWVKCACTRLAFSVTFVLSLMTLSVHGQTITITSGDGISGTGAAAHQLFNGATGLPANGASVAVPPAYRKIRLSEGGSVTLRFTLAGYSASKIYTATIVAATGPGTGGAGANANIANFSVKPGSEIAAASDYSLSTTALSFNTDPANLQITQDVTITATQDTIAEFDEDILIYVQSFRNATDGANISGGNPVAWAVVTIVYQDTPPGAIDYTYADDTIIIPQPGANNTVNATILDASGRALIGGDFTGYSATPRNRIARILTTGANDATFDPGSGANAFVSSITVYTNGVNNGRIFIGGGFTAFNGSSLNSVARLLATGAVDTSFNPGTGANGPARAVAIDSNGKSLVTGEFTLFNGTARNRIVRLNADGSVDTTFAPGTGANGTVYSMVIQSDGKILIGGDFTSYNGTARARLARLNTDGSLDFAFDPGAGFNDTVFALTLDQSQRILVGGAFTQAQGVTRRGITRLTTAGAQDTTFNPGVGTDDTVYTIQEIPVGATRGIMIGGVFTHFNTTHRRHIARLYADGTSDGSLDTSWLDRAYNQNAGFWSLQAATSTFGPGAVTVGTPGTFTVAGHGLANDDAIIFYADPTPGRQRLPSGLLGGTTYYVIVVNANSFQVSLTPSTAVGGANALQLVNAGDPDATAHFFRKLGTQSSFVTSLATQADGNIVVGGKFDTVGGDDEGGNNGSIFGTNPRNNLARLKGGSQTGPGQMAFAANRYFVDEYAGTYHMTINRLNGNLGAHTVALNITSQSATFGTDFSLNLPSPSFLTWDYADGGHASITDGNTGNLIPAPLTPALSGIQLAITQDLFVEGNEDALFTMSNVQPTLHAGQTTRGLTLPRFGWSIANIGAASINQTYAIDPALGFIDSATLTIVDDDFPPGFLGFTAPTYTATENQASITVTVGRVDGSYGPVSIRARTLNSTETPYPPANLTPTTAVQGTDYTGVTNTIFFANGETNKTFTIPLLNDNLADGTTRIVIQLDTNSVTGGATNSAMAGSFLAGGTVYGQAVITISDDDPLGGVPPGSVDTTFAVSGGADNAVQAVAISRTNTGAFANTVVIGGDFSTYNSVSRSRLARLTTLGALDTTLSIGSGANNSIYALAVQDDSRVIIGGAFTTFNTTNLSRILRLNSDGSIDSSFNPGSGANGNVLGIAIHPTTDPVVANRGKVVIVGDFTQVNGVSRNRICRLNTDGSVDSSFVAGTGANSTVRAVAIDANGQIYVAGDFSNIQSATTPRRYLAKLLSDGTLDTAFPSPFTGAVAEGTVQLNALAEIGRAHV